MVYQKEVSSHEKQIITLGRTLQALREEESIDGLVQVTQDYLRAEFNYPLIWVALYDADKHGLIGKGGVCPNGEIGLLTQKHKLEPGDLLEQVILQQRPLGVPDLKQELRVGEWHRIATRFNIQGTLLFPIRYKQTCYGLVLLGSLLWGTSPHAEEKARLSIVLGELAEVLHRVESDRQRKQVKRPDEGMLNLLPKLRSLPSLKKRLEAVIQEIQQFVQPDRTTIYWYEAERRFFWRRASNRGSYSGTETQATEAEISAQEVSSFYHSLMGDHLVCVGEANSHFRADVTGKLIQLLQAKALIAAPILFQGELRGFVSVESLEPRIWSNEEKNFVRATAQLVALTSPLEEMEEKIQQAKLDQALTAEISRAIYSHEDWVQTLKTTAEQLGQHLRTERLLALVYNKDLNQFDICYQSHPKNRRPLSVNLLPTLEPVDWRLVELATEAIAVENLEEDLKFMPWRGLLLNAGVRSLLVCSTSIGKSLEGIIVVGHDHSRSWNRAERELLAVVSQQLGLLLHQFQLQRQTDQLQKNAQLVQWGLATLQQAQDGDRLEQAAVRHISQILEAPLTALITWAPTEPTGKVAVCLATKKTFNLAAELTIPLATDSLVQRALEIDGSQSILRQELSAETQQWLPAAVGQVLVMPLRTAAEHERTGILLVGDRADQVWTQLQLGAFATLVDELAWCRRNLQLSALLCEQRQLLQQLNWYKQRRIEEMYRTMGIGVRRLNEMGSSHADALSNMRYPQILKSLGSTVTSVTSLLKHEQWMFHDNHEIIPLASLMKRALERVDGIIKQRQLWSQVHNEASLSLAGDIPKIEFVLHEVLSLACWRSPATGRIDIWCRDGGAGFVEISITDTGVIDPRLLEELQVGRGEDLLAPSPLDVLPGLHLVICQALMERIGGELSLERLDDGRIVSRLLIPIGSPELVTRTVIQED